MPSNIGICFVCLSNDPKDTYIQSNADNDVYIYIYTYVLYNAVLYSMCIPCTYFLQIYIYISEKCFDILWI